VFVQNEAARNKKAAAIFLREFNKKARPCLEIQRGGIFERFFCCAKKIFAAILAYGMKIL